LRRFALAFAAGLILFYCLASTTWFRQRIFDPVLAFEAEIAARVAAAVRIEAQAEARRIQCGTYLIELQRGCDALEPSILFALAVLAAPAAAAHKAAGIAAGALLLFLLNIVRVVTLLVVSARRPRAFELVHMEWQVVFVVVGIAAWAAWAAWSRRARGGASHAAA
jgi:exosortase/archaeosortase family protein